MNSKLLIAASLALAALHGAASAETSSYAERMRLIGRTVSANEVAPTQFVDSNSGKLLSAAEQREQHAARMSLIGRTPAFGETSAAAVVPTVSVAASAEQQFEQRMKLIGRTVQYGEVAGDAGNQLSAQRGGSRTAR